MKINPRRAITLLRLLLAVGVASLAVAPAVASSPGSYHRDPAFVAAGRDLPRTRTIGYNSEKGALAGYDDIGSLYYQPLNGQWESKGVDREGNQTFSCRFKIPFDWAGRQQFLHVGSVNSAYEVYINDQPVAYTQGGRAATEFDITPHCAEGLNTLKLIVYGNPSSRKLEDHTYDPTPSLTGETYIISQPKVRIRDIVTNTILDAEGKAVVELGVVIKTHLLNNKDVRLHYSLLDPAGGQTSYGHRDLELGMRREDTVRFLVNVPDVRAWSHDKPDLYTLLLRTQQDGKYTEYIAYRIGLRNVEVRGGKFHVNGREVPLTVAEYTRQSDRAATAAGLRKLKDVGVTAVKVRNFPQPDYFYALCDSIGMYVCNQADINTRHSSMSRKKGGNPTNDPLWQDAYVDRVMAMYHTSQAHPSVVMFSPAEQSSNGNNLYESYYVLKKFDNSRPVVYTDAGDEWNTDAVNTAFRNEYPTLSASRLVFDITPEANVLMEGAPEITQVEGDGETFRLQNNYTSMTLSPAYVTWSVKQSKRTLSQAERKFVIPPDGTADVQISLGSAKRGKPVTVDFAVMRAATRYDDPASEVTVETEDGPTQMIVLLEKSFSVVAR